MTVAFTLALIALTWAGALYFAELALYVTTEIGIPINRIWRGAGGIVVFSLSGSMGGVPCRALSRSSAGREDFRVDGIGSSTRFVFISTMVSTEFHGLMGNRGKSGKVLSVGFVLELVTDNR